MISIISAIGQNNELGKNNTLLWDLPADMKHFRETTSGHPVVMGERTFKSLFTNENGEQVGKPLPNRRNIIITLDQNYHPEGTEVVHSIDELMDLIKSNENKDEEFFIIGGGQIYKQMIEKADKLYITHVGLSVPDADTYFPTIDQAIWSKTKSTPYGKDEANKYDLEFAEYTRK